MNHRERFERWQRNAPKHTSYLAKRVMELVVPEFERDGFMWCSTSADGILSSTYSSSIPLQKKEGDCWPTVLLSFDRRHRPFFQVWLSVLPEKCKEPTPGAMVEVDRLAAHVTDGPVVLDLRKGRFSDYRDGLFGFHSVAYFISNPLLFVPRYWRFLVDPDRYLDLQVDELFSLLPELFELFERGFPKEWCFAEQTSYVSKHFMLMSSWYWWEKAYKATKDDGLPTDAA